jgi:hypothetical protein
MIAYLKNTSATAVIKAHTYNESTQGRTLHNVTCSQPHTQNHGTLHRAYGYRTLGNCYFTFPTRGCQREPSLISHTWPSDFERLVIAFQLWSAAKETCITESAWAHIRQQRIMQRLILKLN